MPGIPIATSRYKNPYKTAISRFIIGASRYLPFNGALPNHSPSAVLLGATQEFTVASVPANLSTLIINPPNGGPPITFQFLYGATANTVGIPVPLPNSGSSTAAQVNTALLAVLAALSGVSFGGVTVNFPWTANQTGAAKTIVNFNVRGTTLAPTGTQATISVVNVQSTFATGAPSIGRVGPAGSFLPNL